MTEADFSFLAGMLRKIQSDITLIKDDVGEIKTRLTLMESHEATFLAMLATHSGRMDRFEQRLERIEHRLELRDEPS